MPAPYDYTIGDIASPQQSFIQGIQMVDALRKREQDQAAALEAKRKEAELQALYAEAMKPGAKPDVFERLSFAIDPKQAALSRMQQLSAAQQDSIISNVGSVWTPLLAGKPDLAIQRADELIKAMENSANPDQKSLQALKASRQALSQSPELAQVSLATTLMGFGDKGSKFVTNAYEAIKKPVEQRKAAAEAQTAEQETQKRRSEAKTAEIAARYAEPQVLLDLEAKGWNLKKIRQEIETSQQQSRLALLQAQLAKEDKELKRQELQAKIDEAKRKQSTDLQQKVADVEGARFNIDNMLNTADRILKNPSLNSVIGTIQGRMPVVLSDESQDAVALIETLGSQAFLSQIPNVKGMGALSNAEGEKLQNAFQNLGRVQSEKQFKENLKEAQRLLLKARQNVSTRYGVPETVPDTPAAKPAEGKSIDEILKELGVSR